MSQHNGPIVDRDDEIFLEIHEEIEIRTTREYIHIQSGEPLTKFEGGDSQLEIEDEFDIGGGD